MIGAVEMDIEHDLPVFRFHFENTFVPEDPGIVDEDVYPAEGIQRCLDNILAPLGSCHTVVTGHGFTAQILYF